ncbi:DUF5977 domain-containing protein [Chryseobacterium viscerum]|uniref:DUF5977 domain-containing protein n=1 Tax=Chryseobacterium viscerum TaxID=1037377 RepID=A0A316WDS4_9FLAO|nr:DUF5977 domain-containing protein [Chryseobacterium viscerum]PWN59467.1 hypothetical protein C1634_019355 [Chryseobacterium viscerum]
MKKKRVMILLLGLSLSTSITAQDRPSESLLLIDKVSTNNDLYKGTLNVNIPLFEISLGNLKLKNEIANTFTGFDPKSDESIYGLNWYGNPFGQITREIKGNYLLTNYFIADEYNYNYGIHAGTEEERQQATTDCILPKSNLKNGYSKKQALFDPTNNNVASDFNPDKFYFDFFGYSGYFTFDNNRNPIVYCENARLKIQLVYPVIGNNNESMCYSTRTPLSGLTNIVKEIIITDDKGNKFYFGGTNNELEINYSQFDINGKYYLGSSERNFFSGTRANYIISWQLKKVETYNGDTIIGKYEQQGDLSIFNSYFEKALINSNNTNIVFPTSFPTQAQLDQANIYITGARSVDYRTFAITPFPATATINNFTKRSILKEIEVVGKNLKINYNYFKDSNNLLHLSSINLNSYGNNRNFTFNQIPLGGQNYRYFLESIEENNGEKYSFEYNKTDVLPAKSTNYINGFGYWTGANSFNNDNNLYDITSIKKVIYPTKGFAKFYYEPADYNVISEYSSSQQKDIFTNTSLTTKPLVRLKSKIESDGSNQYETFYTYKLNNGSSSGILRSGLKKNPINYSQVQEKKANKGMTEYFFADYYTNPDNLTLKNFSTGDYYKLKGLIKVNRDNERGKTLNKKVFDASNILLKESFYEYENFLRPESELLDNPDPANCTTCKISDLNYYVYTDISKPFSHSITTGVSMYVPVVPYLLKKEKVINYLGNKQITEETNIKYRESSYFWHTYPEQVETTTAEGTSTKKSLYAYNLYKPGFADNPNTVGEDYTTYNLMLNANIMNPILEIEKNKDNKYSLRENQFYTGSFAYKKIRDSKLNSSASFTSFNIPVNETNENISYDLLDNKANYLQVTDKSGASVVTLYGYNQTLPIAKIEGITYIQLMQLLNQPQTPTGYLTLDIVGKSNADIDSASEQELINALELFKKNPVLKGYPITTYTYDPLRGMTSMSKSPGGREFYKYDNSNRLEKVLDKDKNIIKDFKYNYAPLKYYSSMKSQTFTTTNCMPGTLPVSGVYTVPEFKYSSTINQADADQQAQNDINLNGQNYINSNYTCTPYVCSITPTYLADIYYSSFQEISTNHFRAYLSLPLTNTSGGAAPNWSNGVMIGTLGSLCRPSNYKYVNVTSSGSSWTVTIGSDGMVTLRSTGGTSPGPISLTFEYDKY